MINFFGGGEWWRGARLKICFRYHFFPRDRIIYDSIPGDLSVKQSFFPGGIYFQMFSCPHLCMSIKWHIAHYI